MDDAVGRIQQLWSFEAWDPGRLVESLVVIAAMILLRWAAVFVIHRQTDDLRTRYQGRKIATYLTFLFALILIGRIWFQGVQTVATFLGLVSAGVAIALRDPIVNLAGWAFILWRRPFAVGDRIQVGQHAGDVVDLRVFQFTILEIGNWVAADQSTGRIIHIPNGKVFTDAVANYVRGFRYIWHEIPVLITFESDWRKAKRILTEVLESHSEQLSDDAQRRIQAASQKFMIFYNTLTPIVYTSVSASGVLLTMRFLCDPRRRRGSSERIWEEVLARFAEHDDIDFAYPTQRLFQNALEGKHGARARLPSEAPPPFGAAAEQGDAE